MVTLGKTSIVSEAGRLSYLQTDSSFASQLTSPINTTGAQKKG
jgi:hypothetical protein